MPSSCSVAGCTNSNRHKRLRPGLIHHTFPVKDSQLLKKWIHFCKRQDPFDPKSGRVCSEHFEEEAYERDLQHELLGLPPRKKLKLEAVPTIFNVKEGAALPTERTKRCQTRAKRTIANDCLDVSDITIQETHQPEVNAEECLLTNECGSETIIDPTIVLEDKILVLQNTVAKLSEKIVQKDKVIGGLRAQISKLKHKCTRLSVRNKTNSSNLPLTHQQQQRLQGKRVNWKTQDIVRALTVRSVGLKAYETARKYWKLPLPSVRTLQRWASNFTCEEGLLYDVLSVMKCESETMEDFRKICCISFDEMNIHSDFVYDKSLDRIRTDSKAQVLMVRGLFDSWKQPVFFDFDCKMDQETLFKIIISVERAGFQVVTITSDLGPDNRSLWKALGVNERNTSFVNPSDHSRNIYTFADVPHMIKLIRNHILDDGIILKCGTKITKQTFQALLEADDYEIKLCPNFTSDLLDVSGAERMRVRPAVRLLSNRVAVLARKVFAQNSSIYNFIKCVNDGFDVLDSRVPSNDKNPVKSGYGMKITYQTQALENLLEILQTSRFLLHGRQRKTLLPCQIGFIVSIKSTIKLFEDLQKRHGVSYVLTSRLNQDALESLFSSVRAYGGPNQNPSPIEFKYRLRLILLGSNLRAPKGTNVIFEDNSNIMSASLVQKNKLFSQSETKIKPKSKISTVFLPNEDLCNEDALQYLAGYIAWKVKRQGKGIHGTPTPHHINASWISSVSRGGLLTPKEYFFEWIKICNQVFNNLEGSGFISGSSKSFIEKLIQEHPEIPENVAKEFVSLRLKIRTKFLNSHKGQIKSKINAKKAKQFSRSKNIAS